MGVTKVNGGAGLVIEDGAAVWQLWVGQGSAGLHDCVTLTESEYNQARLEVRAGLQVTGVAGQWLTSAPILPYAANITAALSVVPHSSAWG